MLIVNRQQAAIINTPHGSEIRPLVDRTTSAIKQCSLAVVAADRLGEPAQRAGAEAAEDDARLPGLAQDLVDAVRAPDAEQAQEAAAADVDQVLGEQVRADVARRRARAETARCGRACARSRKAL